MADMMMDKTGMDNGEVDKEQLKQALDQLDQSISQVRDIIGGSAEEQNELPEEESSEMPEEESQEQASGEEIPMKPDMNEAMAGFYKKPKMRM